MKNRLKLSAAVLSAAFALSGMTAFAQSSEPAEPTTAPDEIVIEDNHTLTPDGNAQLMDDVTDNENLQFITVTARDGNEFYIIIDKGAQSENVYFLNTVDESDLAALVEDYTPGQTTQQQPEPSSTPSTEPAEPEQEQEKQPEPDAENTNSSFLFLIVLILAGGAGLAVYYFKVFRPKKKLEQADDIEDFGSEETENEEALDEETEDKQK